MDIQTNTYRILLIGNSYTYYNELWDRLSELATLAGIDARIDHVTKGGAILAQMLDPNEACGAEALQKLTTERYDAVVLQDNSLRTIRDREGFETDIKRLHELIKANGAIPLLYQTWARRAGSSKLTQYNLTPESMTNVIARAYREVGAAIGARVAHVGDAFYDVVCNHPEINLYDPDGTHPSPAGTALAALCIFIAIFDRSPEGLPFTFGTDSEEQAAILRRAAIGAMEK